MKIQKRKNMTSYDSVEGFSRDQIILKTYTVKFLEEKIEELLNNPDLDLPCRDDDFITEVLNIYVLGIETLRAEIIDLEKGMPSTFKPMSLEESYVIETGEDFADYVATSLNDCGFKIYRTPRSHDGGCDLVAVINSSTLLCQVKQVRSPKVLNNGVEQVIAAKLRFERSNGMVLVTNALSITKAQQELAREAGVIVICGDAIGSFGSSLLSALS